MGYKPTYHGKYIPVSQREYYYSAGILKRPGENDAGNKRTYKTNEAGDKKYWQGKTMYKYKVTFSDGTSITVSASSADDARAMFKDKKIKKVNELKEKG